MPKEPATSGHMKRDTPFDFSVIHQEFHSRYYGRGAPSSGLPWSPASAGPPVSDRLEPINQKRFGDPVAGPLPKRRQRVHRAGAFNKPYSALWLPSQSGDFPVALQAQNQASPVASAVYFIGLKLLPLWVPSQNGCLADFPHEHQ